MGYHTTPGRFLKVYASMPNLIPSLKRFIEEGVKLSGVRSEGGSGTEVSAIY